jgi:hypothetical protein
VGIDEDEFVAVHLSVKFSLHNTECACWYKGVSVVLSDDYPSRGVIPLFITQHGRILAASLQVSPIAWHQSAHCSSKPVLRRRRCLPFRNWSWSWVRLCILRSWLPAALLRLQWVLSLLLRAPIHSLLVALLVGAVSVSVIRVPSILRINSNKMT